MIVTKPSASDIMCNSVTATTAGVITIPPNRWYTCTISMSVVVTVLGTSTPTLTFNAVGGSTGMAPASGTVLQGVVASAVTTNSGQTSDTVDAIMFSGTNGATLDYAVSGATASRCTVNGFLL